MSILYKDKNGNISSVDGSQTQFTVLPTPSADLVGKIYQYIGNTTLTFTNGWFYKCVSNELVPPTYSWVQIDVQPATSVATESTLGVVKPDNETIIIDPDGTIHALGGGGGIHLANVSGVTVTSNKRVVSLKWSDPPDVVVSGITLAEWAGTKVLRKVGAAPTGVDDEDATLIIDSTTRNAYSSTPLEDNTVSYETQYYYKFFPYTVDELYTSGSAVGIVPEREVIDVIPSQSGRLEYTGEAQSPTWNNYNSDELTIGGTTSGAAVDTYTATFTPKFDYMWSDGTQATVDVSWTINNIVISTIPSVVGTLTYTGNELIPTWNNYDSSELTIGGDTSGTNVGSYTTTFTPKTGYEWSDGSISAVSVTWTISPGIVSAVPMQSGSISYTGETQTPTWSGYNTDELTISGDTSASAIGTYTVTFTPKPNYEWWDGTTTGKTATWSIEEAIITTVPSQQGTITYNGTEQTAVWNNFNADELTVSGNTGTDAGTYTASFTPKVGYQWSDRTTTAKTASWVIDKANSNTTLSTDTVTLDEDHMSITVMVSNVTGDISVSSGESGLATASYDNGIITVSSPDSIKGNTTITVTVAPSSNYNGTQFAISVTCDFLTIRDWKDGVNKATDAELADMIAAADRGELDLELYWAVGDLRTITLGAITTGNALFAHDAQTIYLVLMDTGNNSGYKDTNDSFVNFVWGQKNTLDGSAYMRSSTSIFSWETAKLREDLNSIYYNALPSDFRNCLKEFKVKTIASYNSSTIQTSLDKISLFAEKEVNGASNKGSTIEADNLSHIEYYKTTSNRIKKYGTSNTTVTWWLRSPYASTNSEVCTETTSGSSSRATGANMANSKNFVAPFGCI